MIIMFGLRSGARSGVRLLAFSLFVMFSGLTFLVHPGGAVAGESYTLFESGQVRPLAMSSDGKTLFALNTPDNRLEAFIITPNGLQPKGSVLVGIEPVAVAVRNNDEVWVVNHVSDSVSIVDVRNLNKMRVTRTLLVGDEPGDVVFAGPGRDRAFITTAHRGQNVPYDPQLTTPGVGRADVWAFDAANVGTSLGGTPLRIITLFTDTPRALTVSPDGSKVYAAGFKTGNRTTTIFEMTVSANGGLPPPSLNYEGATAAHRADCETQRFILDGQPRSRLGQSDKVQFAGQRRICHRCHDHSTAAVARQCRFL